MENTEAVGGSPATSPGVPVEQRAAAGLQAGRIVNYVMLDGSIRPLIVVRVWQSGPVPGYINGVLIFDGLNDASNFPSRLDYNPQTEIGQGPFGPIMKVLCEEWVTSTHYDEAKSPGTWHWPDRATRCGAESRIKDMLGPWLDAKLQAHLDTVNRLLDSHSEVLQSFLQAREGNNPPSGSGCAAAQVLGGEPSSPGESSAEGSA